jgi:2-polyprenyl-3-methyl-5-hydroxy-6-metoxy-1,4-benzoquinol methylase
MSEPEGGFGDEQARDAWNEAAAAYEEFVESGADYYRSEVHGPALLAACEPIDGLDVLDLGCGQGGFCRALARRGARVVGVDIAEQVLFYARAHEEQEPLGIDYQLANAGEVGARWGPGRFDLVTAAMALHDMADVAAVLRAAFQVLKPDGRMAVSLPHPWTDTAYREWEMDGEGRRGALKIDRYFDSGAAVRPWAMERLRYAWDAPFWRLTLHEWSELIAGAGFLMRRLYEPRPTAEQVARHPRLEPSARLPGFLIVELVKPPRGKP